MKIMRTLFFSLLSFSSSFCFSQNRVSFLVTDAADGNALSNVSIVAPGDAVHTVTKSDGTATVLIPSSYNRITIRFSRIGYRNQALNLAGPFTKTDSVIHIHLEKDEKEMDEVIIASGRTNSRIENSPTRVEVLGMEEVEEESGIKPSNIASLLGDVSGIQAQQPSAINNNIVLRIQGLPGSYTQLLRDGMPLFGGYAGSFSILQVAPLDLKQIEIIKGSNSTLYGGGAIAGLINIISKKPKQHARERYLLLNQSSLRETNLHLFLSEKLGKAGYTFFAGANYQRQEDVNNDGFSDLARTENAFIHPTFYFYPNAKNILSVGIHSTFDNRKGGDMEILEGYFTNAHQFSIQNQTYRNTIDIIWENTISTTEKFTLKGTTSNFNRNITTSTFGMKAKQLSYFSEATYLKKSSKHDFVAGMNITGESLKKRTPDSTLLSNYNYFAIGLFLQDDWRISSKLTLETGIRADFHNIFKAFVLPRFSLLYKINHAASMRLGGGLGYRIPTIFETSIDERDYRKILPFSIPVTIRAERSLGLNWDLNIYHQKNETKLTFNQALFVTNIQDPVIYDTLSNGHIYFFNAVRPLLSYGSETYFLLQHGDIELYLGYNYTVAKKQYDPLQTWVELSARHRFASVLAYELSQKFTILGEAAYTGKQYLDDGSQSPGYFFIAAMMRYTVGHFSFVLNCENLLDYRQSKKEAIVLPPYTNPRFKQLWAPIDGRVINLSMKIRL